MRRNILFASGMCILLASGTAQAITRELHAQHSAQFQSLKQKIRGYHVEGSLSLEDKDRLLGKIEGIEGHNFDLHVTAHGEDSVKNHAETLFYSQKNNVVLGQIQEELMKKLTKSQ